MSWLARKVRGTTDTSTRGAPWSSDEISVLANAVRRAPSVHNTQPWSLEVRGRTANLRERLGTELIRHDPRGRDRRISCGAALANLVLAVRHLGWAADVRLEFNDEPPSAGATVTGSRRAPPTATEGQRYRAIVRRTSHRRPFEDKALSHVAREAIRGAANSPLVRTRWVTGQTDALELARLLTYAARARRGDPSYQRELAMWTVREEEGSGEGVPVGSVGTEGVPAVGLVTHATRLPDEARLATWIDQESILVLSTPSDEHSAQLQAGEAMELAWLEATSVGLVASVMTQPLQLSEVRTELAGRLGLSGEPQMLMRFGYPLGPVSRSERGSDEFGAGDTPGNSE